MATLTPDQLGAAAQGIGIQVAQWAWLFIKILFFVGVFALGVYLVFFNIKVIVAEQAKNNRVILSSMRMREVKGKDGKIKLNSFSLFNFIKGVGIDLPSSECLFPYRGTFHRRCYTFVKKDGVYHPVNNFVAGLKYIVEDEIQDPNNPEKTIKIQREVYSLENSGLELTRDFNSEQAISNDLMAAADRYRNKKPVETFMLMGLMLVVIIGSFIVLFYAFKQVGSLSGAISQLSEPLKAGVSEAISQRLGPS